MLWHAVYAIVLVSCTVFVHAGCMAGVLGWLRSLASHHRILRSAVRRAALMGAVVLLMSLAAYLESALWAGFYVVVGALPQMGDALYFSLVTFTTLGYGDVTLGDPWRRIAAFEAANGIIMFGWTTALIVAVAQRLFLQQPPNERGS